MKNIYGTIYSSNIRRSSLIPDEDSSIYSEQQESNFRLTFIVCILDISDER